MVSPRAMAVVAALATLGCSLVNAPDSHTRGRDVPGQDGGSPTLDGGSPSPDGGSPSPDGGSPTLDGGLPTLDGGSMSPPRLRVAHLARGTGAVDVYADEVLLTEGLGFPGVGMPAEVPAGEVVFAVRRAGTTGPPLVERALTLAPGREYTLTFHGDEEDPPFPERTLDLLLLDDDASGLDITRDIRLAVIHVATPVIAGQLVAILPDGNRLLANDFGFRAVARIPALPSMNYTVGFDAGANGVIDLDFDLPRLVPGTFANVFVASRSDGSVFLLVNTQLGATLAIDANPPS